MAELLLKIGDGASYKDGDCICAFSDRQIAQLHAEQICGPKRAARNASGLLQANSLTRRYLQRVSQYRFNRVSPVEVIRTEIASGTQERFGAPDIDVRLFVWRRKREPNAMLFGEDGREIWFGGRVDRSAANLTQVWRMIERQTGFQQSEELHGLWAMGRQDVRSHLAVRVDGLNDKQARSLAEPQFEVDDDDRFVWDREGEEGVSTNELTPPDKRPGWKIRKVAKRRRRLNWERILGDLSESRERIRNAREMVGRQRTGRFGVQFTSKDQPLQRRDLVTRKAPKRKKKRGRR